MNTINPDASNKTVPHCDVCGSEAGPFNKLEVSDDGEAYEWINTCPGEHTERAILRWKIVSEIVYHHE